MSQYTRRIGVPLALSFALFAGACTTEKKADDTLAQDSALNRDLNLANRDTTAQPALTDVPAAPATTTPAPKTTTPKATTPPRTSSSTPSKSTTPSRPANTTASGNTVSSGTSGSSNSGGKVGTIAAGTTINLASNTRVCTNSHKVGDTFTARVAVSVTGSNGATIPAGATATVRVTELKRSENANDNVVMGFAVSSVTYGGHTYNIDSDVTYAKVDKVRNQPKSKDAQKVVGGAAIGAIIGQAIGKNTKGTVIGGAGGAPAGTAAAPATANDQGCGPGGGQITIKRDSGAQVRA
jgi:hypothetical protein